MTLVKTTQVFSMIRPLYQLTIHELEFSFSILNMILAQPLQCSVESCQKSRPETIEYHTNNPGPWKHLELEKLEIFS